IVCGLPRRAQRARRIQKTYLKKSSRSSRPSRCKKLSSLSLSFFLLGFDFGRNALLHVVTDPAHVATERLTNSLDLGVGFLFENLVVTRAAIGVFGHPFVGEAAALDVVENALHLGTGAIGDDTLANGDVAPLGGVGDGFAHT